MMTRFPSGPFGPFSRAAVVLAVTTAVVLAASPLVTGGSPPAKRLPAGPEPSAMGAIFMGLAPPPAGVTSLTGPPSAAAMPRGVLGAASYPLAPGEVNVSPGAPRFQSETTIAVHEDTVVVGFNDASGFSNPAGISVSGFSYSHDGGQTFTYGGQLPVVGNGDAVRGDPDVKVWVDPQSGQATFVYSSLYGLPGGESSLCVHVSTTGGATWAGPREATTVTTATDFADKEFLDLDPETGRIVMSWTNFGSSLEMKAVYSDDLGLTWSGVTTFSARPEDGQGSCPRFDPTSDKAYIVWRAFGSPQTMSLVRSLDNGATWDSPRDIASGLITPVPPYGSDRINGFPSLAVSPLDGSLHLVYSSQFAGDMGRVYYTASADSGDTWSTPVAAPVAPGLTRAQFFPWISAGPGGGLDIIWYDQRAGGEGSDLTEMVHTHSDDGGLTWGNVAPLTSRPFHAEYGQDTGQPNLGDYNQCVSREVGGFDRVYAAYSRTAEASYQTAAPDAYVAVREMSAPRAYVSLDWSQVNDSGCTDDGILVATEAGALDLHLHNHQDGALSGLTGLLGTTTPAITLLDPFASFATASAWGTTVNTDLLRLNVGWSHPCGEPIDLRLTGTGSGGDFLFDFELPTGVVVVDSLLLAEDFEVVGAPLPPGWSHLQRRGVSNPWAVTTAYASSGSRSVGCADYPDTNWSRLESPVVSVPAFTDVLEITFDVTYEIEELGNGRQAWDGALLKIRVDGSDVLAQAFSTLFENQYLMQIVRGGGDTGNPLEDLSCWSGNTLPDFETIRLQYRDLAGKQVRLAFEMGSDGAVGGTGIFVDDLQVRALDLDCGDCLHTTGADDPRSAAGLVLGPVQPTPMRSRGEVRFSLPEPGPVWASVFDASGRRVRTLRAGETFPAGAHQLVWDARDERGAGVGSGIYFLSVRTLREVRTSRALVVR